MTDEIQGSIEEITFDYDGYQVVRGEFLSRTNMPAICFDGVRLSVNTACLRKMPDVRYIQFLVNPSERKLVLRPCGEDDKDSFLLCGNKGGKPIPRKIVCRLFTAKLAELMNWDMDNKYRIMGSVIKTKSDRLILFDLNAAETLCRTVKRNEVKDLTRKSFFPEEWRDHFGLMVKEHEKSIMVNLFDDYTVFSLNE